MSYLSSFKILQFKTLQTWTWAPTHGIESEEHPFSLPLLCTMLPIPLCEPASLDAQNVSHSHSPPHSHLYSHWTLTSAAYYKLAWLWGSWANQNSTLTYTRAAVNKLLQIPSKFKNLMEKGRGILILAYHMEERRQSHVPMLVSCDVHQLRSQRTYLLCPLSSPTLGEGPLAWS